MPATLDLVARLHRRLLEIVGTTLPLMPSAMRDADLDGLAQLRWEMVEAMAAYRRHAEQAHTASLCCGNAAAVDVADALCRGARGLERAYEEFRQRWAHRDAVGNWAEYRLSAIRMMKQVRNQVQAAEEARVPVRQAA